MTTNHLCTVLTIFASASLTLAAENQEPARTICVSGTHVTRVAPDVVVWNVIARDFDPHLQQAKDASDAKLKAVLKLAEELGVKPDDIQTDLLSIQKEYEREEYGGRGAFKYFVVTRQVTLRQRDIQRFDKFLSQLVGRVDIEVSYSLECSRQPEVRAEARLKAVHIAKTKAEAMAHELGVKVGRVMKIDEIRPAEYVWRSYGTNSSNSMNVGAAAAGADGDSGAFAPGQIEVTVTIELTFEIE